jgi:hypothetical protein
MASHQPPEGSDPSFDGDFNKGGTYTSLTIRTTNKCLAAYE